MFFKKTVSIAVSILMFACMIPAPITAFAAYSGDYRYSVTDGCAVIEKYLGTESEVNVPCELGGCPVTKIARQVMLFRKTGIYTLLPFPTALRI